MGKPRGGGLTNVCSKICKMKIFYEVQPRTLRPLLTATLCCMHTHFRLLFCIYLRFLLHIMFIYTTVWITHISYCGLLELAVSPALSGGHDQWCLCGETESTSTRSWNHCHCGFSPRHISFTVLLQIWASFEWERVILIINKRYECDAINWFSAVSVVSPHIPLRAQLWQSGAFLLCMGMFAWLDFDNLLTFAF